MLYFWVGAWKPGPSEVAHLGVWLSQGGPVVDFPGHFLEVAEHHLVSAPQCCQGVATRLRSSGVSFFWALACQDSVPGGHAGVGDVSFRSFLPFPLRCSQNSPGNGRLFV